MATDGRVPGFLGRVLAADGSPAGTCFQVAPGVLVTAWHVLEEVGEPAIGDIVHVDGLGLGAAPAAAATVLAVDPVHDLAVLRRSEPLPASERRLEATDAQPIGIGVVVTGHSVVEEAGAFPTRHLDVPAVWAGTTTRGNAIRLGRLSAKDLVPGMSGAPVRRLDDGIIVGVVSARYNSADGWLRDSVWVARSEHLAPLLAALEGDEQVTVSQGPKALKEARRQQKMEKWEAEARRAAERERWDEAVRALERVIDLDADSHDVRQRLDEARRRRTIAELQAELERLHESRSWRAAVQLGERLRALDPAADPLGLAAAARAELVAEARRPRKVSVGHRIAALDVSPDGDRLGTGSLGQICVWNLRTGEPIWRQSMGAGRVTAAAVKFSRDGLRLATGGTDGAARIWDAATGRQQLEIPHARPVRAVAFSPDGRCLATGSNDRRARIWDAATGRQQLEIRHLAFISVIAVAFSPDGRRLATGGTDGTARIWDATTGREQLEIRHHHLSDVGAVAFSPDGRLLATGSTDGTGRISDAVTGRQELVVPGTRAVHDVAFSPDGLHLATGRDDGSAWVSYISPLRLRRALQRGRTTRPEFECRHDQAVRVVVFSPYGQRLLTGSDDGTVRIWDYKDAD